MLCVISVIIVEKCVSIIIVGTVLSYIFHRIFKFRVVLFWCTNYTFACHISYCLFHENHNRFDSSQADPGGGMGPQPTPNIFPNKQIKSGNLSATFVAITLRPSFRLDVLFFRPAAVPRRPPRCTAPSVSVRVILSCAFPSFRSLVENGFCIGLKAQLLMIMARIYRVCSLWVWLCLGLAVYVRYWVIFECRHPPSAASMCRENSPRFWTDFQQQQGIFWLLPVELAAGSQWGQRRRGLSVFACFSRNESGTCCSALHNCNRSDERIQRARNMRDVW